MLRFSVCMRNSTSTQIVTVDPLKHTQRKVPYQGSVQTVYCNNVVLCWK